MAIDGGYHREAAKRIGTLGGNKPDTADRREVIFRKGGLGVGGVIGYFDRVGSITVFVITGVGLPMG